jgi:DNA modification methylase
MQIKTPKIETINFNDIEPAPYNPREISEDAFSGLRNSLMKFGYVDLIIVNKRNNRIVSGHQRHKILLESGVKSGPAILVDFDPKDEKALNVTMNNQQIAGAFTKALIPLIKEIEKDLPEEYLELQINKLRDEVSKWDINEGQTDPDEVPEAPNEPVTQPGDIWTLGHHRVMCGDSTKAEDMERLMQGKEKTPAMMLTDPPYFSGGFQEAGKASGSVGTRGHEVIANDTLSTRGYQFLIKRVISNCPVGVAYVFTDWRMWINLFDIVESCGFRVRNMIVWDKKTPGMGSGWRMQHELVMCGIRVKSPFNPKTAQGNVIQCKRTGNVNHATEKPTELLGKIIMVNDLVELVIDPFLGSGSTLIACEETGRTCYGMELTPRYCDVIVQRWENFTGKKAVRNGK